MTHGDHADDQSPRPQPVDSAEPATEKDKPREGLELGGNIASIIDESKGQIRDHAPGDDDNPRKGLGTGGSVQGPEK